MNTREKIYDNSISLFAEHGMNNVTVRQIAQATGIKESSIYNHFSSKNEIIACIYDDFKANIQSSRKSMADVENELNYMKPQDFFKSIIMDYGKSINDRVTKVVKIIMAEQFQNDDAKKLFIEEMINKPSEYFCAVLDYLLKTDKIHNCDTYTIARLFNSAHLMLCIELAHCSDSDNKNQVLKLMFDNVEYFIGGIEK